MKLFILGGCEVRGIQAMLKMSIIIQYGYAQYSESDHVDKVAASSTAV